MGATLCSIVEECIASKAHFRKGKIPVLGDLSVYPQVEKYVSPKMRKRIEKEWQWRQNQWGDSEVKSYFSPIKPRKIGINDQCQE